MILSDNELIDKILVDNMITLRHDGTGREYLDYLTENDPARLKEQGVISYGISSIGVDVRLSPYIKRIVPDNNIHEWDSSKNNHVEVISRADSRRARNMNTPIIMDPKEDNEGKFEFIEVLNGVYTMMPGEFILGSTSEFFNVPDDVGGEVKVKSTYARNGLIMAPTVLEPGWCGHLTLEIYNPLPHMAKIYIHEGISQICFDKTTSIPSVTYKSRGGKYLNQSRYPTVSKVKKEEPEEKKSY